MLVRGADPDAQDTNGNTVLHLLVILEKLVITLFLKISIKIVPAPPPFFLFGMYQTIWKI
jgi:hypothetical protein